MVVKMVHLDWRGKVHILALIIFLYFMMIYPHESTIKVTTSTRDYPNPPYSVFRETNDPWYGFVVADGVRTEYEGIGKMEISVRSLEYAEFYHFDDLEYDLCVSILSDSTRGYSDSDCSSWASMDPARVEKSDTTVAALFIGFCWAWFIFLRYT